jgi:hypothetical protein
MKLTLLEIIGNAVQLLLLVVLPVVLAMIEKKDKKSPLKFVTLQVKLSQNKET